VTTSPDLPLGLTPNFPAESYHAHRLGVVRKGALDLIERSPAHYYAWVTGAAPRDETPAFRFGRIFHTAILEPAEFARRYVAEPDFGDCRFKEAKRARDEWRKRYAGLEPVSATDMAAIRGMVESIQAHPLASKILRDGEPELTAVWRDDETGLTCQVRPDYYVRGMSMVADLKTTEDASEEGFKRTVGNYRYHVQDALYRAGMVAVGEKVRHFVFVAVEKTPPHAVAVYTLDDDAIGRGYHAARRNIETMAECLKSDKWPGYPERITTLELPPWV